MTAITSNSLRMRPMSCGHLYKGAITFIMSGWSYIRKADRSSPFIWATDQGSRQRNCGQRYRRTYSSMDFFIPTIGRRTEQLFQRKGTCIQAGRNGPIMWSDSIVRCGKGYQGWLGKHYRFPKLSATTSELFNISFATTNYPYKLNNKNHICKK